MIKPLYYQFLLYRNLSAEENKVVCKVPTELSESFLKYLFEISINPHLIIQDILFSGITIELDIDYQKSEIDITWFLEVYRNISAENTLKAMVSKIFVGYSIREFHSFEEYDESWGCMG